MPPKKTQPSRRCPICRTRRGTNREDAQPDWMRQKLIASYPDFAKTRREIVRICEPCNSYFGRTYDHPAAPLLKPMLDGQPVTLAPGEQALLGKWFVKTTLMRALRHAKQAHISRADRARDAADKLRNLMEHRALPPGTTVRLGAYDHSDKSRGNTTPMTPPAPPRFVLSALGPLDHVFYQVLIGNPELALAIESSRPADDAEWFIRVWPPRPTNVQWPPPRTLGTEAAAWMIFRWQPPNAFVQEPSGRETTVAEIGQGRARTPTPSRPEHQES